MASSSPTLPVEILYEIIRYSDVSSFYTFTRVNTTFRHLTYQVLDQVLTAPPSQNRPEIPHDLAIHILNNQSEKIGRSGVTLVITRDDDESAAENSGNALAGDKKEEKEKTYGQIYAPFFTANDWKAGLGNSLVRAPLMVATKEWFDRVGSSGNDEIDLIRREREMERIKAGQ